MITERHHTYRKGVAIILVQFTFRILRCWDPARPTGVSVFPIALPDLLPEPEWCTVSFLQCLKLSGRVGGHRQRLLRAEKTTRQSPNMHGLRFHRLKLTGSPTSLLDVYECKIERSFYTSCFSEPTFSILRHTKHNVQSHRGM